MDADHVTVRNAQGGVDNYPLVKFARSNAGTCINPVSYTHLISHTANAHWGKDNAAVF